MWESMCQLPGTLYLHILWNVFADIVYNQQVVLGLYNVDLFCTVYQGVAQWSTDVTCNNVYNSK